MQQRKYTEFHGTKRGLRATMLKSAETVHLILLCNLDDAIRCAVSADSKMVARNHPLHKPYSFKRSKKPCQAFNDHPIPRLQMSSSFQEKNIFFPKSAPFLALAPHPSLCWKISSPFLFDPTSSPNQTVDGRLSIIERITSGSPKI